MSSGSLPLPEKKSRGLMAQGRAIAEAREAARKTQPEVAAALSVNAITISRWERGVSRPPSAQLSQLEGYLGLKPGTLGGKAPMHGAASRVSEPAGRYQVGLSDGIRLGYVWAARELLDKALAGIEADPTQRVDAPTLDRSRKNYGEAKGSGRGGPADG